MMKLAIAAFTLTMAAVCMANNPYEPSQYKSDSYKADPYKKQQGYAEEYKEEKYHEPKYDFHYTVKDDEHYNDFGHKDSREGDKTEGEYHVLLPDGRTQHVKYYVDGYSGFVAEVTYSGEVKQYDNSYKSDPYKASPSYKNDAYKADPYNSDPYKPSSSYHKPELYKADPYKQPNYYKPTY